MRTLKINRKFQCFANRKNFSSKKRPSNILDRSPEKSRKISESWNGIFDSVGNNVFLVYPYSFFKFNVPACDIFGLA